MSEAPAKSLIVVCGAKGVGKSSACRALVERLECCAYIDSDWCRCIHPFAFTPETIGLVVANIAGMMANYFRCSTVDHVIFSYGFHGPRRGIYERVLATLAAEGIGYRLCPIVLQCDEAESVRRMRGDGRDEPRIVRALATRRIYDGLDYPALDVSRLTVPETARAMLGLLAAAYGLGERP
jgi:hypothetical protein